MLIKEERKKTSGSCEQIVALYGLCLQAGWQMAGFFQCEGLSINESLFFAFAGPLDIASFLNFKFETRYILKLLSRI